MKKILILGAGLSASSMIKYLLDHAEEHDWTVRVGDISEETAKQKIAGHKRGEAFAFDVFNEEQKQAEIKTADVVISLLPASFHPVVAKACLEHGKHMLTASYVSPEMKELHQAAQDKGILMLNEIGVDPGIDHMSAMKVIDKIKADGGKLLSFKSNTGGLVAPEFDTNPWNYKFTWNPRNVVVAGQSVAKYIEEGQYKYVPYQKLFTRTENVSVLNVGEFEVYPNRDSLSYRETYDIQDIPTLIRGTMRRPGYSKAWNVFVQLGTTDDTYKMMDIKDITYRDFINSFLPYDSELTVEEKLAQNCDIDMDSDVMKRLQWLGIFETRKIGMKEGTPAQILQKLLEEKWALGENDKDMIAMQHLFEYEIGGKRKKITSSLVVIGEDTTHTAMSITVGIPVAIATKLLLTGIIKATGVVVPTKPDIYEPVLAELENFGIKFVEEEIDLN